MGFEGMPKPAAKQETAKQETRSKDEIDKQLEEVNRMIEGWKKDWRKAEERNYEFRMNFSANTGGKPVDFVELDKGNRLEQEKYNAYKVGEKETKYQMDTIRAKIDELEKQKTGLIYEKSKLE